MHQANRKFNFVVGSSVTFSREFEEVVFTDHSYGFMQIGFDKAVIAAAAVNANRNFGRRNSNARSLNVRKLLMQCHCGYK